tara:strand:- start:322 stop:1806 length:1485 start_codon:yes stop_codon:yes gene_type:complete
MLGTLAVIGQLAGAGMNIYQGYQQKKDGETLAEQGREDMLKTAGPTDELLSSVDEQKRLVTRSGDLAQERMDMSVTGLLDALASGDPAALQGMQGFGSNLAKTSQDVGLKTATAIAQANQPAVDAAESAMDVSRNLAQLDLQSGTAAFNQGQQTINEGIGAVVNMPMDMASLQTANPDAYSNLFGEKGLKTKRKEKDVLLELAMGGLVYGGTGISGRSFRDIVSESNAPGASQDQLEEEEGGYMGSSFESKEEAQAALDGMSEKERAKYERQAKRELRKNKRIAKRKGYDVTGYEEDESVYADETEGETADESKGKWAQRLEQALGKDKSWARIVDKLKKEDAEIGKRGLVTNEPTSEGLNEEIKMLQLQLEKEKVQKELSEYAMGGVVDQIIGAGGSFVTPGVEDHDKQEYNIEDANTGEVVAKTTGDETHMVNEDGTLTVMNSEQTDSIHDAFKDVDVDMVLKALQKNPQKGSVRDLLSALNKVFSQKQFKS